MASPGGFEVARLAVTPSVGIWPQFSDRICPGRGRFRGLESYPRVCRVT